MRIRTYPKTFIYFALFLLYYLLDVVFPMNEWEAPSANRIYPQFLMGIIFVYSIFYIAKNYYSLISKSEFKPFLLFFIYSVLYVPFCVHSHSLLENAIQFMKINMAGVCFIGFFLSINKHGDAKWLYRIYFIQLLYAFYGLCRDYYMVMVVSIINNPDGTFDSNSGFILASLLPMSLMLQSNRTRLLCYFTIVFLCLFSGQRSAALAAVTSIPFAYKYLKNGINKRFVIFFLLVSIIVLLPYIELSIDNFILRQEVDDNHGQVGSGRSEIWSIAITSFLNGNLFQIILGGGYFSINELLRDKYGIGIGAHNGFIEHLYVFGAIGLLLYLGVYFMVYKKFVVAKHCKSRFSNVLLVMLWLFIVRSASSHGNLDVSYIPFFMPLAIILANEKIYSKELKHEYRK